jgi:hypothetical protein
MYKKMTSELHIPNNILEREAYLYSNYLLDREPPEEIVKRYVNANRKLGIDVVPPSDANILKFSLTHPWSIPFLDAATGFLHPDSFLRKKIYTMAAVLEATPRYTEDFLPQNLSPLKLFVQLIANGLTAGIKVMIGIPMFLFIRRHTHD